MFHSICLAQCHRLNFSVASKYICLNLMPNVVVFRDGALGKWSGYEGGAFMNGVSALIKETPRAPLSSRHVTSQQEDGRLWTTKQALTRETVLACRPWTSRSPKLWERNLCGLEATPWKMESVRLPRPDVWATGRGSVHVALRRSPHT